MDKANRGAADRLRSVVRERLSAEGDAERTSAVVGLASDAFDVALCQLTRHLTGSGYSVFGLTELRQLGNSRPLFRPGYCRTVPRGAREHAG
jgi:hypothetical protein